MDSEKRFSMSRRWPTRQQLREPLLHRILWMTAEYHLLESLDRSGKIGKELIIEAVLRTKVRSSFVSIACAYRLRENEEA